MISLRRTVAPAIEPVTLDQAKDQCRVAGDVDSNLLVTYITAAREYAEKQTNRAFITQTWRLSLDAFPGYQNPNATPGRQWTRLMPDLLTLFGYRKPAILLPRPHLISVVSITYLDITGARQTLDPSKYLVETDADPGRVIPAPGQFWPPTIWGSSNAVEVTYTAGYGDTPADVPATVQLAILGLVAHWYENRESVVLTSSPNASTTVPQFVDALLMSEEAATVFDYEAS